MNRFSRLFGSRLGGRSLVSVALLALLALVLVGWLVGVVR